LLQNQELGIMAETIGSMLPLALLFGLTSLVFWWVRRRARNAALALRGPHGWLALFIWGSYIFSPLLTFGTLSNEFSTVERQYPNLLMMASWGNYKTANWLLFGASVVWQWWVAYSLHKNFVPSSVTIAKTFLLVNPVMLAVGVFVAGYMTLNYMAAEAALTVLLKRLASGVVWLLYFKFSRRVKNTYFIEIDAVGSALPTSSATGHAATREEPTFTVLAPLAKEAPTESSTDWSKVQPSLAEEAMPRSDATPAAAPTDNSAYSNTLNVQLDALKRMLERGALTDVEYERKRQELLARI
jgi:hypothetical protein